MSRCIAMYALWLAVFSILPADVLIGDEYNPLAIDAAANPTIVDLAVHDAARNRDIPILAYIPPPALESSVQSDSGAYPVVLFSHGLGGARTMGAYLGNHWARRGFVAVFLQHPGSDDLVWRNQPLLGRMSALRQAANSENFVLRVQDVSAVLDQLEKWNAATNSAEDSPAKALAGNLNLDAVGMSGHSFGAVTTQAVSGQSFAGKPRFTDPRIKAAICMSPSMPRRGRDPALAFGSVKIPWLLMTGTHDAARIGEQTVESRQAVFPALPEGSKYELVLDGAEHSAFTDRALPGDRRQRNPNHHRAIQAISTAFWDAYLKHDADAVRWLASDGPASVLEPADQWLRK